MEVHRIELIVIDHDGLGAQEVVNVLENTKFPNRCINPTVRSVKTKEIGEWSDDNPLNKRSTAEAEFKRLFDGE